MIDLTRDAQSKLEEYIARMRRALRGTDLVERSEVEQNVRDHVDAAFAGATSPVGPMQLGDVLARLGPPEQWIAEEDKPLWKRVLDRLLHGPEDWRLAYLCFGVTILALLTVPLGIGVFLFIPAYLLGRAHLALIAERGESLGARRWLVLPVVALMALFVVGITVIGPIGGFSAWGYEERGFTDQMNIGFAEVPRVIAIAAGSWLIFLSAFVAIAIRPVRSVLYPFAERLQRRHTLLLTGLGAAALAIGLTVLR